MSSGSRIHVPWPEEYVFADQLALLDRQIASWTGAIRQAHQALRQMAGGGAPQTATALPPGAEGASDAPVGRGSAEGGPAAPGVQFAPPGLERTGGEAVRASQAANVNAREPDEPRTDAPGRLPAADVPVMPRTLSPEQEAEQALLDSLDRETQLWIRVRQRLSPAPLSVRELLAEREATKKHRWRLGGR